ncbi:hypothetical protein [Halomonas tibetensis]|uniref:Uncharacterized protein n=1 Tax=Halomonas tibetensis TaxID=2259590 RepID=A0ABV7B4D8_9GAMM
MGARPSCPGASCSKLTTLTSTMFPLQFFTIVAGYIIEKIAQDAMLANDRDMVVEDDKRTPHEGF